MSDKHIDFIDKMISIIPKAEDSVDFVIRQREPYSALGWYYEINYDSLYKRFEVEFGTYDTIDDEEICREELTYNTPAELKTFFENELSLLENQYDLDEDLRMMYSFVLDGIVGIAELP